MTAFNIADCIATLILSSCPLKIRRALCCPQGVCVSRSAALSRAEAVVLIDSQGQFKGAKSVWRARRVIEIPGAAGKIIAFVRDCASPAVLDGLKSSKLEIAGTVTFRDHHRYQQCDINRLLQLKKQTGADSFITTEKDLINLGTLSLRSSPRCSPPRFESSCNPRSKYSRRS